MTVLVAKTSVYAVRRSSARFVKVRRLDPFGT